MKLSVKTHTNMKRSKKMIRKRIPKLPKIPNTPARQVLMNHVIKVHPYWRKNIEYMTNNFLLLQICSMKRELFTELLKEENNIKYLK